MSVKRHTPAETKLLWAWLAKTQNKWWTGGAKFSPQFGWLQIFEGDNWHCVYCGADLARSEDALAESTEEHLVPQSLLNLGKVSGEYENNVSACCAGCNGLKGSAIPVLNDPAWQSRAGYIKAMRDFIHAERQKRAARFLKHAFRVRAARVWTKGTARQNDYL